MEVKNNTQFLVNATPQFIRSDATILTVMVKGTFTLNDQGQPMQPATEQHPIIWGDELYDGESTCVRLEGELLPFKPKADVLVIGDAMAPGGKPVEALPVSVRVGAVAKEITVFGNRHWQKDSGMPPKMTRPEPFTLMEVSYQRAFGGFDLESGTVCLDNPVGMGIIDEKASVLAEDVALPNVENPEALIQSWQDRPEPVSFGVVGRGWPRRLALMGTYDEKWQEERAPDPPEDFNSAFYNCASPDLQSDSYFQGNELVEVAHMSPTGAIACHLPGLVFRADAVIAQSDSDDVEELMNPDLPTETTFISLNLDTVTLFPNTHEATLIWRGFTYIKGFAAAEVRSVEVKMDTQTA